METSLRDIILYYDHQVNGVIGREKTEFKTRLVVLLKDLIEGMLF